MSVKLTPFELWSSTLAAFQTDFLWKMRSSVNIEALHVVYGQGQLYINYVSSSTSQVARHQRPSATFFVLDRRYSSGATPDNRITLASIYYDLKAWSCCPNLYTAVRRQTAWSCCPNVYTAVRRQTAIWRAQTTTYRNNSCLRIEIWMWQIEPVWTDCVKFCKFPTQKNFRVDDRRGLGSNWNFRVEIAIKFSTPSFENFRKGRQRGGFKSARFQCFACTMFGQAIKPRPLPGFTEWGRACVLWSCI